MIAKRVGLVTLILAAQSCGRGPQYQQQPIPKKEGNESSNRAPSVEELDKKDSRKGNSQPAADNDIEIVRAVNPADVNPACNLTLDGQAFCPIPKSTKKLICEITREDGTALRSTVTAIPVTLKPTGIAAVTTSLKRDASSSTKWIATFSTAMSEKSSEIKLPKTIESDIIEANCVWEK